MILFLAAAAAGLQWLAKTRMNPADEVMFEEEYPVEIISLKLN
jgi:hypothetical protein